MTRNIQEENEQIDAHFEKYYVLVLRIPHHIDCDADEDTDVYAFSCGFYATPTTYDPDETFAIDDDCDASYTICDEMDQEIETGHLSKGTYRLHDGNLEEEQGREWIDVHYTQDW